MPTPDTTVENPEVETISDDQLDEKRDEIANLRAELDKIESDRLAEERAKANASVYDQLESEGDRLRALIAAAKGTQPDIGLDAVSDEQGAVTADGVTGDAVPTVEGEKMGTVQPDSPYQAGAASTDTDAGTASALADSPTPAAPATGEGE